MKHIKELAANALTTNLTKSQESQLRGQACPDHWTAALFKKFIARYGYKWTKAIEGMEEEAVTEWSIQLSGLTGEQIKHGLVEWDGDWPPSSTEFRKACLDVGKNEFGLNYIPEYYRTAPVERRIESDDLVAKRKKQYKAGIANLRKILQKPKT